jgi:hypothetical protein
MENQGVDIRSHSDILEEFLVVVEHLIDFPLMILNGSRLYVVEVDLLPQSIDVIVKLIRVLLTFQNPGDVL